MPWIGKADCRANGHHRQLRISEQDAGPFDALLQHMLPGRDAEMRFEAADVGLPTAATAGCGSGNPTRCILEPAQQFVLPGIDGAAVHAQVHAQAVTRCCSQIRIVQWPPSQQIQHGVKTCLYGCHVGQRDMPSSCRQTSVLEQLLEIVPGQIDPYGLVARAARFKIVDLLGRQVADVGRGGMVTPVTGDPLPAPLETQGNRGPVQTIPAPAVTGGSDPAGGDHLQADIRIAFLLGDRMVAVFNRHNMRL
jgi:hypothetical protein